MKKKSKRDGRNLEKSRDYILHYVKQIFPSTIMMTLKVRYGNDFWNEEINFNSPFIFSAATNSG